MMRLSLGSRVAAVLALFGLIGAAYIALYWVPESARLHQAHMMAHVIKHAETVSRSIATPLFERRFGAIYQTLDRELADDRTWAAIELKGVDGKRIYPLDPVPMASGPGISPIVRPVTRGGAVLGHLTVAFDARAMTAAREAQERRLAIILIGSFVLLLLSIWLVLDFLVRRPSQRLAEAAKLLAAGEFDAPLPKATDRTMADLVAAFSAMREAISERQIALMESVEERRRAEHALSEANEHLDRRVRDRTQELRLANATLQQEVLERIKAEEEQRRSQQLLSGFIDNAPFIILYRDTELNYRLANRFYLEAQRLNPEDLIGRSHPAHLPDDVAAKLDRRDRTVLRTGETLEFEDTIPFPDGKDHDMHITKFPVFDSQGGVSGVGTIAADITRLRSAEAQLRQGQKLRAVGQLTGGVAHDFNNLLGVILGNAQLLQEELPEDNRFLDAIIKASARGSQLTHRLLAFSRQQPLAPDKTDIDALVTGTFTLLERTLGEDIDLSYRGAERLWQADVDAAQLENALLNLVINARDAMPEGGRVTVEAGNVTVTRDRSDALIESLQPGDYVSLAVTDTGTGMAPDVQEQVFEPFFTTKDVGEGSGLGLSMVYGFVTQSGGTVTIDSTKGRGTTVTLYLRRSMESRPALDDDGESRAGEGGRESILVLEDDEDVRNLARAILESLGYRVSTAGDGASALALLKSGADVDLVLSDVVLKGGMNGPEFADRARELFPDLPVTYMSGYTAEAFRKTRRMRPSEDLIHKPFRKAELAQHVRNALDRESANPRQPTTEPPI
ncbi:MAG: ATP-binding protein [Alphaproteobacteria bacterium]|nr:ATP-binding protein [Alphaproteobacteria bacterium]